MAHGGAPDSAHARWIGCLDIDLVGDHNGRVTVNITRSAGYRQARILLRDRAQPIDFVEADIVGDTVTLDLPGSTPVLDVPAADPAPPISVVLCTRERPEDLAGALASLSAIDYPDFEIIVVDNAPVTDATERVVAEAGDARIRRVLEPIAGLSNARNAGLHAAQHDIVAFTDDDVVVDTYWLQGLARGFARSADVACVCGMVPSGELRTAAQVYFDQRVSWAGTLAPRAYSMAAPPPDLPLFPFQVGIYGTGANFAVRRRAAFEMGGFDEALGAGTSTKGGEDIDMFFRLVAAGHTLVNEPAAIVWHRHRSDSTALLAQARGYGLGLGAWLTKVFCEPAHRRLAFSLARRQFRSSVRAGAGYGAIMIPPADLGDSIPRAIGRTEVLSVLGGPLALWRGRRQGRRRDPMHEAG
ncbi:MULTISPECIES: glycosyltransferase family 2 protein [Mycolicibacterium]|uniref:Glycosyl transferase family protein n=1 Tax=Mycolicibacterium neoaurum TaxID=1795 RepID=A0AAV2WIR6_MYCNE|nr:glycosyltransferase [Mycolicibacterium neoaurum]TLH63552.1 glycosyl transferase family 2 [Mycolicibacterium neoaurum]CDQ44120.1 glycosyl transferase family protein [Mycolicibacterium neoaurum]